MGDFWMVLIIGGVAAWLYKSGILWGELPGHRILTVQNQRRLAVLPVGLLAVLLAADLVLGEGTLAGNPVLPAAAIFYCILIIATRRIIPSLALSLGLALLSYLPSPLL